jgi:predicted small secreted protein
MLKCRIGLMISLVVALAVVVLAGCGNTGDSASGPQTPFPDPAADYKAEMQTVQYKCTKCDHTKETAFS